MSDNTIEPIVKQAASLLELVFDEANRPKRYMLRADLEKYQQLAEKTEKHIPKSLRDGDKGRS